MIKIVNTKVIYPVVIGCADNDEARAEAVMKYESDISRYEINRSHQVVHDCIRNIDFRFISISSKNLDAHHVLDFWLTKYACATGSMDKIIHFIEVMKASRRARQYVHQN